MARDGWDKSVTTRRCLFSDAVGRRVAGCTKAVKKTQQYRRTVHCRSSEAHAVCAAWLDTVRRGSRFAMGTRQSPSALPRRAAVKLQCGGLLGMRELLGEADPDRIQDVSALLRRGLTRFESFERVPLDTVIQQVHEFDSDDRSGR